MSFPISLLVFSAVRLMLSDISLERLLFVLAAPSRVITLDRVKQIPVSSPRRKESLSSPVHGRKTHTPRSREELGDCFPRYIFKANYLPIMTSL